MAGVIVAASVFRDVHGAFECMPMKTVVPSVGTVSHCALWELSNMIKWI